MRFYSSTIETIAQLLTTLGTLTNAQVQTLVGVWTNATHQAILSAAGLLATLGALTNAQTAALLPGSVIQQSAPSNPAGTTSTAAQVMMGLAIAFTPSKSGKCLVMITLNGKNSVISDGWAASTWFGTGAAPINGAARTGTVIEAGQLINDADSAAANRTPFTLGGIVTLVAGTTYWIDIALQALTGGTASLTGISINIMELGN
jgi:hypothetical protein